MQDIERYIKTYVVKQRELLGQIPKEVWTLFPDFLYKPYIIRAKECFDGVATRFVRPAHRRDRITIKKSLKARVDEAFLPSSPLLFKPIIHFKGPGKAQGIRFRDCAFVNVNFARNPEKGRKFMKLGENFKSRSIIGLDGPCEAQMIDCLVSGVVDKGRYRQFFRFLWMITRDCVDLSNKRALWLARKDFIMHLDHLLFVWSPKKVSDVVKNWLIEMLTCLTKEFQKLISRTDVEEEEIQDFFEEHRFIIDPSALRTYPKQNLGGDEADFILIYNNSIRVVEIKRPRHHIFGKKGMLSQEARRAIQELTRYQDWLTSNAIIAMEQYGAVTLEKGWAIMGMKTEMTLAERQKIKKWNSRSSLFELKTFDDLLESFERRTGEIMNL